MKVIERLEEYIPIIFLFILFIVLIVQTFFRYVLSNSLLWPEEIARYAFIALVYFGSGVSAREGRHLEISVSKTLLGEKIRRILVVLTSVITTGYCILMTIWGFDMAMFVKESQQVSASIPIPTYIFYLCIPIGMIWMAIRTITFGKKDLRAHHTTEDIPII